MVRREPNKLTLAKEAPAAAPAAAAPAAPAAAAAQKQTNSTVATLDWPTVMKDFTAYYINCLICKCEENTPVPTNVTVFFADPKRKQYLPWWNAIQYYMGICKSKPNAKEPNWTDLKLLCTRLLAELLPDRTEVWDVVLALGTVYLQCTASPPEVPFWNHIHQRYMDQRTALLREHRVLKSNPEWMYMFRTFMDLQTPGNIPHLYHSLRTDKLKNDQLMKCMDALLQARIGQKA